MITEKDYFENELVDLMNSWREDPIIMKEIEKESKFEREYNRARKDRRSFVSSREVIMYLLQKNTVEELGLLFKIPKPTVNYRRRNYNFKNN